MEDIMILTFLNFILFILTLCFLVSVMNIEYGVLHNFVFCMFIISKQFLNMIRLFHMEDIIGRLIFNIKIVNSILNFRVQEY